MSTPHGPATRAHATEADLLDYIAGRYAREDSVQQELRRAALEQGLPPIHVSPTLGRILSLLVGISGARRILEIGTLAGNSAIWMARALPAGGTLLSLEREEKHAALARGFIEKAGLADRVTIRVGPALDSLAALTQEPSFDLVFIDANKDDYPAYLEWALRLTRPGSLILADNVIRNGAVLETDPTDADVRAVQRYNDLVAHDPRLEAVILFTRNAGDNLDGISVARVRANPSEDRAFAYE